MSRSIDDPTLDGSSSDGSSSFSLSGVTSSYNTTKDAKLSVILALPTSNPLSLNHFSLIFTAFATSKPSLRTLSLAVLARFLIPSPLSGTLVALKKSLISLLAGVESEQVIEGLTGLSAILQVTPSLGVTLLKNEEILCNLEEVVETIGEGHVGANGSRAPTLVEQQKRDREVLALVELLSLASGQSGVRVMVRKAAQSWVESILGRKRRDGDEQLRAWAGLTIVKLRLGKESESATGIPVAEETSAPKWSLEKLVDLFTDLMLSQPMEEDDHLTDEHSAILLPCLEALAYLTLLPSAVLKNRLLKAPCLTMLYRIAPFMSKNPHISVTSASGAINYAVATLLSHLTAYPPEEENQSDAEIRRLRTLATPSTTPQSKPETKASVNIRNNILVAHTPSVFISLNLLRKSSSRSTRRLCGSIFLALVEQQSLRPKLLQHGVANALTNLIRRKEQPFTLLDLPPIQALAKIMITNNPKLLSHAVTLLENAEALVIPLGLAEGANLLLKFECVMALTNIASVSGELAYAVADLKVPCDGYSEGRSLFTIAEELALIDNTMIRRAATELICNTVTTDAGYAYYSPTSPPITSSSTSSPLEQPETVSNPSAATRLAFLVELCCSVDIPTALAASGAVVMLTENTAIALELAHDSAYMYGLCNAGGEEEVSPEDEKKNEGLRLRGCEIVRGVSEAIIRTPQGKNRKAALGDFTNCHPREALEEMLSREKVEELKGLAKKALKCLDHLGI